MMFTDIEKLPSSSELEEVGELLSEKFKRMVDIPSDFHEIINDNLFELIDKPVKEDRITLSEWKLNAEEDYPQTPISVLKYITELENNQKR